jgi:hypothetical protein
MNKYNKSIIYKIEHLEKPELVYVGGTTNFSARKAQHKSRSINPNDKEYMIYKYKMIRENGGWNMFRMVALKNVNVNSKRELEMEEEKVREELKATLNKCRAYVDNSTLRDAERDKLHHENAKKKLEKERQERAEEISKYKNDKAFLNIIKKKKYNAEEYKELFDGTPNIITTISSPFVKDMPIMNHIIKGDNGYIDLTNIRIVDLEKESLPNLPKGSSRVIENVVPPVKKRGRPKKINV